MTTTAMWHPTRATDRPVYHDDTRCPAIDLPYRRPGDGSCTPCEHCVEFPVQTIEATWGLGAPTTDPLRGGLDERPTSRGPGRTTR